MGESKFVKGVLIGAVIGGTLSLLDKDTRKNILEKGKAVGGKLKTYIQDPKETIHNMQVKLQDVKNTYQTMNQDLQFVVHKAAELKELGSEATKTLLETKQVLVNDKELEKETLEKIE
ncbi:YtxH domain-containing protein [Caldibacillus lycopersici]|uniref:YtxH domain-containing protein n=1 Tax=Perspicuibacillus lycopersici TaxID=1325689 RepID=A0AAE3ITU3_9BACI|nr:YtxH domain-containing protein [Perspicuibacillus lycopersici]MCU9614513.1 YtxH domain-containing protein [Perspicuibacillus lycopersici]